MLKQMPNKVNAQDWYIYQPKSHVDIGHPSITIRHRSDGRRTVTLNKGTSGELLTVSERWILAFDPRVSKVRLIPAKDGYAKVVKGGSTLTGFSLMLLEIEALTGKKIQNGIYKVHREGIAPAVFTIQLTLAV